MTDSCTEYNIIIVMRVMSAGSVDSDGDIKLDGGLYSVLLVRQHRTDLTDTHLRDEIILAMWTSSLDFILLHTPLDS